MEIKVDLSKYDIQVLEAYRVLNNYEYNLDLERFINTKTQNGGRYGDDLGVLLDTLVGALDKAKSGNTTND